MRLHEFAQRVRDAVADRVDADCRVELREVYKNNGVKLQGLNIISKQCNIIPTIYLENFFETYEKGMPFDEILDQIMDFYQSRIPKVSIDMSFFESYEESSDRICYRLIGRQGNEELLNDIPYVEFLDLIICFYYSFQSDELGDGIILIHNSHMQFWKIGVQDLMKLAMENTPKIYPYEYKHITEIVEEIFYEEGDETRRRESDSLSLTERNTNLPIQMNVLTNSKRAYGASCILYPGLLQTIAEDWGESFYMIPSSIHEFIFLLHTGEEDVNNLKAMIHEVNRYHVSPDEVLSDQLYYYDKEEKKVRII